MPRWLTLLMLAASCLASPQGSDQTATAPSMSASAVVAMARNVQRELLSLPEYCAFDDIRYSIQAYEVTLRGFASRASLKESAEKAIRATPGVKSVVNKIELLPNAPNDDIIRARIYGAIYRDPLLSHYNPNRDVPVWMTPARSASGITGDPPPGFHPIRIIVNNGNVTLAGVVDNEGDRSLAGIEASTVPGLFSVDNNLAIASDSKPRRRK